MKFFRNIAVLILIALGSFYLYIAIRNYFFLKDKYTELIGQTEKYNQLNKNLAELEIKYEDQRKLNSILKDRFNEIKLENNQKIKVIQQADFVLSKKKRINDKADLIYIDSNGKQKYLFHELHFVDSDNVVGPPIGYVMIFEDGRVVSKIYKHKIVVNSATIVDSNSGRYKIVSKADFILEQSGLANRKDSNKKNWKNVNYPLNIVSGSANVDPTQKSETNKFRFLDPHFDLGINNSFSKDGSFSVVPNLGFSLSSYGISKKDNMFRFFRFGIGYTKDKKIEAIASPIMYNIANVIPVLTNTYIYPNFGYSQTKEITFGIGLSATF